MVRDVRSAEIRSQSGFQPIAHLERAHIACAMKDPQAPRFRQPIAAKPALGAGFGAVASKPALGAGFGASLEKPRLERVSGRPERRLTHENETRGAR
jgi:hypothetical protein